ncbi:wiskott-Aldrich syndrome protein homolog 1-like isoform X7 [Gallus gallus]|uniref:wiskott-Aldrich syndrome protein homolog 1-like isoform X7 n=1 Tax=Gallus gallus TaxID=9031 RepID=UPI001AE5E6F5|nr:wiskott-Aldrich syndrome protein homolog 1-like isoform X7 [Gallus gallus]XP_040510534.1 wiskott-Aldrich syndrome protein homolog 1-like isoform X7 [Gallus gallus]XP_040510535.1 wiskott-Aldrich syndrome protein homolog 1-like isoform X7 [Gallus gallus]
MARVWGATAPTRLALLLLLMAMCSQKTCAAPWRASGTDDDIGAPYPNDWVNIAFVPQGKPRGAGGVEWDPASQLSSMPEAPATPMGPERRKEALGKGKYPQRLSHILKKIMKEKAAHVLSEPREAQHNRIYDPFLKNPGVDGEGRAKAEQIKATQKYYLELAAAVPVSLLLGMILCCLLIWRWRQRNQRLAAADEARDDSSSSSSESDEQPAHLEGPKRQTWWQPPVWGRPAHLLQDTTRAAPARLDSSQAQLPPPRPPWPTGLGSTSRGMRNRPSSPRTHRASAQPPRPPPPSFRGRKEPARGGGLRSSAGTETTAPRQMSNRPSSPRPPTPPPPTSASSSSTILQGTGAVPSGCRLGGIVQHPDNRCLREA